MPAYVLAVARAAESAEARLTPLERIAPVEQLRFELAPTRAGATLETVEIGDRDVVALELAGGFKLWMNGQRLSAEAARPARDGGAWELAPELALEDTGEDVERGLVGWAIEALELFRLDPVGESVRALAEHVERENRNEILVPDPISKTGWRPLGGAIPKPDGPDSAPVLLCIHGTFSTTGQSFGNLLADRQAMLELTERFGTRIYGYEHRTLTQDPIDNLLDLVPLLPDGVPLHLLTYSRGGLLGDLLAFAAREPGRPGFGPEVLALLGPQHGDDPPLRAKLERLNALTAGRDLRVERLVRVASPSRGTTLASGRLDRWLSILANLAGLASLPAGPSLLASGFLDLLVAVAQQATEPESLPGLAAMTPGSPLVRLLNTATDRVPGRLAAVAGDIRAQGPWAKVKLLIPDLFYAGDHDLVVNTGSMYGGPAFASRRYLFDRGPEVDHFSYFLNRTTAAPLVRALTAPGDAPGFAEMPAGLGAEPARGDGPRAEPAGNKPPAPAHERRPVLFVLPGLLGSGLAADGRTLWLDLGGVAAGGLARLDLDGGHRIIPAGLLTQAYGRLLDYFRATHDVVPFAYDWRRSLAHSAARLAEALEPKLEQAQRHRQPVCILAHSSGGLVARALIAEHPRLWQRVLAGGGRLVMLGTPNGGSWEIVRLLTARSGTLRRLALVDPHRDASALLALLSQCPGVLELLPEDGGFFGRNAWERLHREDATDGAVWSIPGTRPGADAGTRLDEAARMRERLREAVGGFQGMLYVAGQAPLTAASVQAQPQTEIVRTQNADGRPEERTRSTLKFLGSTRGDGAVLWKDGPLPGMPTWYMPGVEHGDLANAPVHFGALKALLARGTTDDLPHEPPVPRGAERLVPLPERTPAYFPDQASLVSGALWMGPAGSPREEAPAVQVTVVHGNLAFASHTVAVGHYTGATVIAAEDYLDRVLDGRLRASLELDLYPGPLGTSAHFAHPHPGGMPPGALVVGLGSVGELTPSNLTDTFARALLAYAREHAQRPAQGGEGSLRSWWEDTPDDGPSELGAASEDATASPTASAPPGLAAPSGPGRIRGESTDEAREIALSCLLIGTQAGGFSVRASVLALLRGVARANRILDRSQRSKGLRIARLELIEIRENLAVEAARALESVESDPELARVFDCRYLVRAGHGGHRAGWQDTDSGWWHRLQVLSEPAGGLRFVSLTQRARAEQTLLATQRALVDGFVADAIGTTRDGPETARTLFEMLLPDRLKESGVLRSNLVLVVDEQSARFPWEMLQDRWSGDDRPPAVERGLLRQLQTGTFRLQPRLSLRRRALAIGEPDCDMSRLPGALAEAEQVRDALESQGFEVRLLTRASAREILKGLHADAYQVLHLAGHGVHRERLEDPGVRPPCPACGRQLPSGEEALHSGLVIGPGRVLTAQDVEQMRQVPELVFINCCHLGRTDAGTPEVPAGTSAAARALAERNRLAANLAVAFIGMGVRAVIAAGWAVDDAAALTFCSVFYRRLGAGEPFGEAVRQARERTWQEHPGLNTWGAYQCYGDPDYRLAGADGQRDGRNGGGRGPEIYVSPAEAITDLHNLAAEAKVAGHSDAERLKARLAAIDRRIARTRETWSNDSGADWRGRGDLLAARGLACADLGLYEEAVKDLDAALAPEVSGSPRDLVEHRIRCQARVALERHDNGHSAEALGMLDELLKTPAGPQETPSLARVYSLSTVHWRRVLMVRPDERQGVLKAIVELYEKAAAARADAVVDPLSGYTRLLWLTARFLLAVYAGKTDAQTCPDFDAWCGRIALLARNEPAPGLLRDITEIEVELLHTIRHRERLEARGRLAARVDALKERLSATLRRGLSARQRSGLEHYLRLLKDLLADTSPSPAERRKDAAIAEALHACLMAA